MLRISRITDYGTLILTHMASYPESVFSAATLAAALGLGQPTVAKVLKALTRAGLVRSTRGLYGGYALGRAPAEISVAEIVDTLEEQAFGLTECSATSGLCGLEPSCRIRANWMRINAVVRRALEDVTLADMAQPALPSIVHPLQGPAPKAPRRLS